MSKHGYEQTPIAEIRQELVNAGITDEELLQSSKKVLVDKLLELKMEKQSGTEYSEMVQNSESEEETEAVEWTEQVEELDDNLLLSPTDEESVDLMPPFGSENWTDFVLSKFRDSELIGDAPTCDGCRRLVNELIGPLNGPFVIASTHPCIENEGTATVVVRYECNVQNDTHPMYSLKYTVEDIADVNKLNTDAPYNRYQSATAMTRAEGRALRKILQLTGVITKEEVSEIAVTLEDDSDAWQPDEPITRSQANILDLMCSRANIDVFGYINSGEKQYSNIREVKMTIAGKMIQHINKIVKKLSKRPDGIGPYKSGWITPQELDMLK